MDIIWKSFDQLSTNELYAILHLREQVFMLEQQSLYNDIDGADQQAAHLLCIQNTELVAYLRLMTHRDKITIGRVVVTKAHRAKGLGSKLLLMALDKARDKNPNVPLHLSAQVTSQLFYSRLGFEVISAPYDDGGISHVDMVKTPGA